jgi:signal transduction histidine kinase
MNEIQELKDFLDESYMSEVLHSLNTILWRLDMQKNLLTTNLSYLDPKYTNGTLLHKQSFTELTSNIVPSFREEVLEVYRKIRNGMVNRASFQMQVRINEMREPMWTETSVVAKEHNEEGEATLVVGATTIIQERKAAEMAMLEARRKAEQANLIKTNFLANMTHEFRTPLNSILGFSTIMAHSETIEERMQCLGAVQTSGKLLLQIIDDVIELSKLESNEVELRRNLLDINELLKNVVEEAKPMRKPDVEMAYHNTETNIILHGDEQKISLVLKQILDNACKYTEHGHIDVYCHKSSEHAVITVKDTGAGMSQESVRHIFDRFYKGNSFVPGTGLGMSVVKGLVTLWNGTIKVDSEQHVGTSVTFTIPLHASFYQNRTQREFTHGKPLSVL